MSLTTTNNPPQNLEDRPFYTRHSTVYNLMIDQVHHSAHSSNPRVYDPQCHSLETRTTRSHHETHDLRTPQAYSGPTLKETEDKFWILAESCGHTLENQMRAIYFRDQETLKDKRTYQPRAARVTNPPTSNQGPQQHPFFTPQPSCYPLMYPNVLQPQLFPPQLFPPLHMPYQVAVQGPTQMEISQPSSSRVTPAKSEQALVQRQDRLEVEDSGLEDKKDSDLAAEIFSLKQKNAKLQNKVSCLLAKKKNEEDIEEEDDEEDDAEEDDMTESDEEERKVQRKKKVRGTRTTRSNQQGKRGPKKTQK